MDEYLKIVKGGVCKSTSEIFFDSYLDYFSRHTFHDSFLLWPSILNYVVEKGQHYWDKYVISENYLLTAHYYTGPGYIKYRDWLMTRNFTDKSILICDMAFWSTCTDFIEKYPKEYQKCKKKILSRASMGDNVSVLSAVICKENFSQEILTVLLDDCLINQSPKCAHHTANTLSKFQARSLGRRIWVFGSLVKDNLLVKKIQNHLDVTPDYHKIDFEGIKYLVMGSFDKVKSVSGQIGKITSSTHDYLAIVASRINENEDFSELLVDILEDCCVGANRSLITAISSSILESVRSSECTGKIIRSLNKRGAIFTKMDNIEISSISLESWKAILDNKELFDFRKFIMKGGEMNPRLLDAEQIHLLKKVLDTICPELLSKTSTALFVDLGSSVAKWAYDKGYLKNLDNPYDCMGKSSVNGNVFMLALAMEQIECQGDTVEKDHFYKKKVHLECNFFINAWFKSNRKEKERFINEQFSSNFHDSSSGVNKKSNRLLNVLVICDLLVPFTNAKYGSTVNNWV